MSSDIHDPQVETPKPAVVAPVHVPAPAPAPAPVVKTATPPEAETEFEFSDTSAMTCLLCARKFKTLDQLKRHTKESDLHKVSCDSNFFLHTHSRINTPNSLQKNFRDAALREIAREKASAARAKALEAQEAQQQQQQPKYRDRASERRVMHNQPDIPRPVPGEVSAPAKRKSEGPPPPPSPPPPPLNPGKDENNVGNKLLKMMGWKEGQGLGTGGEGRVDPMFVFLLRSRASALLT